jgi:hypothetical protein
MKKLLILIPIIGIIAYYFLVVKKKNPTTEESAETQKNTAPTRTVGDSFNVNDIAAQFVTTADMTDEQKAEIEMLKEKAIKDANEKAQLRIELRSITGADVPSYLTNDQLKTEIQKAKEMNIMLKAYTDKTGDADYSDNDFRTVADVERAISSHENAIKKELDTAKLDYTTITGRTDTYKFATIAQVREALKQWQVEQNATKLRADWTKRKEYLNQLAGRIYRDLKAVSWSKHAGTQQELADLNTRDMVYFIHIYDNVNKFKIGNQANLRSQLYDDLNMSKTKNQIAKSLPKVRAIMANGWTIADIDQYGNSKKF